eukprot:m.56649 g.56649  ORF g.56649 m.56649 type:complete len:758 (-) comp7808_c0_seq1:417-2690(-)
MGVLINCWLSFGKVENNLKLFQHQQQLNIVQKMTMNSSLPSPMRGGFKAMQVKIIESTEDILANEASVAAFFSEFVSPNHFPDENEREDPEVIKERIREQTNDRDGMNPFTFLICLELIPHDVPAEENVEKTKGSNQPEHATGDDDNSTENENEDENENDSSTPDQPQQGNEEEKGIVHKPEAVVAGGIIIEFYQSSQCALLTYVFVKKECRGFVQVDGQAISVARSLLSHPDCLPHVTQRMRTLFGGLNHVLFESNHPARTDPEEDSVPPYKRLAFFRRCGARMIPFNYVQPPLDSDKTPVDNLALYCFPQFHNESLAQYVDVCSVLKFLMELASSLDEGLDEPQYQGAAFQDDLALCDSLARLPKAELSSVSFKGVTFQGENLIQNMYFSLLHESKQIPGKAILCPLAHVPLAEDPHFRFPHVTFDFFFTSTTPVPPQATVSMNCNILLPDMFYYDGADGTMDCCCTLYNSTVSPSKYGNTDIFGRVECVPCSVEATFVSPAKKHTKEHHHRACEEENVWRVRFKPDEFFTEFHIIKLLKLVGGDDEHALASFLQLQLFREGVRFNLPPPEQGGAAKNMTMMGMFTALCTAPLAAVLEDGSTSVGVETISVIGCGVDLGIDGSSCLFGGVDRPDSLLTLHKPGPIGTWWLRADAQPMFSSLYSPLAAILNCAYSMGSSSMLEVCTKLSQGVETHCGDSLSFVQAIRGKHARKLGVTITLKIHRKKGTDNGQEVNGTTVVSSFCPHSTTSHFIVSL